MSRGISTKLAAVMCMYFKVYFPFSSGNSCSVTRCPWPARSQPGNRLKVVLTNSVISQPVPIGPHRGLCRQYRLPPQAVVAEPALALATPVHNVPSSRKTRPVFVRG